MTDPQHFGNNYTLWHKWIPSYSYSRNHMTDPQHFGNNYTPRYNYNLSYSYSRNHKTCRQHLENSYIFPHWWQAPGYRSGRNR